MNSWEIFDPRLGRFVCKHKGSGIIVNNILKPMRRAASSLTKTVVKPFAKGDLGRKKLHLDIIPIDSANLLATCDIPDFQFRFSSKITPRKFVSFTSTIFWLSILIWILQIERFCLGLKTINLVFLRFRESLFALNQIDSLSISKFNISER